MRAFVLKRTGRIEQAFALTEMQIPTLHEQDVLIKVEAFGLNYADGMAIKGQYRDAPPLPSVLGYDVCGRVVAIGSAVSRIAVGDRVTAMTRFGGYAEYAKTDERAVVKIDEGMSVTDALSLATQGATAWYCSREAVSIYPNDRVLVTAAAGGVGSIIIQLAKYYGAKVYAIVGSNAKKEIVQQLGADVVFNRNDADVFKQYQSLEGKKGIDVMFDSAGGSFIRKGIANLAPGGRMVGFGAAQGNKANNIFAQIKFGLSFGFYHPAPFLLKSHSLVGVNMLQLADHKPEVVAHCLSSIAAFYKENVVKPLPGKIYAFSELVQAHKDLATGSVSGKIAVTW